MIYIIDKDNRKQFGQYLKQMFEQRHEFFVETRGWYQLSSLFQMEIDQFDSMTATYIVLVDDGTVIGSLRMMPTTVATFIGDQYSKLITDKAYPARFEHNTWEMFRLFVHDNSWRTPDGHPAVRLIMIAMMEFIIAQGGKYVVAVSDVGLLAYLPEEWSSHEIGKRHKFEQKGIGLGEAALVEIEADWDAVQAVREKRDFYGYQFKRAEEGLDPAPSRVLPEELYALNSWLDSNPDEIRKVRRLVELAEQSDEDYAKYKKAVTTALAWHWQNTPGPKRQSEERVWH